MSKNIKAVVVILALALIGVIIWAVVGQSNLGSLQSSLDQVSGQLTEQQALVAEKEAQLAEVQTSLEPVSYTHLPPFRSWRRCPASRPFPGCAMAACRCRSAIATATTIA